MILLSLGLIIVGALPLIVFLIKRKHYRTILRTGTITTAEVKSIQTVRRTKGGNYDRVTFWYLPTGAVQYLSGSVIANVGAYKREQQFDIYYLQATPQKHAVPGSKGETFMLIFMVLIFLFTVFAAYKIYEMLDKENTTYQFSPPWNR